MNFKISCNPCGVYTVQLRNAVVRYHTSYLYYIATQVYICEVIPVQQTLSTGSAAI